MMNPMTLDDRLTLSFPDGFHVMSGAERSGLQFLDDGPGECLSDPERHILISIGWKPVGGVIALLVNAKDAARRAEAVIRKPMRSCGYHLNGFAARNVGEERAEGFGYEYEAQGVGMYGETSVIKHDRKLYYLNFYARRALLEESLDVWNRILSSAKWA